MFKTSRVVRAADLAGSFVFAVEGANAAISAHLDPIGVLVLAFVTALGGGMLRDVLIGATPVAALADRVYAPLVVAGAAAALLLQREIDAQAGLLVVLDAGGLALFAVAGAEKALEFGVGEMAAILLGAVSATGGGAGRDLLLGHVPRVLYADVYATAALLAGIVLVSLRRLGCPTGPAAVLAGLACFALRLAAVRYGWALPRA